MSDVVCEVIAQLPTKYGTFEAHGYVDQRSGEHHVYISKADILIIGGTSLAVYPAAGLIDYYRGNKLVLVNKSPTPADRRADLVIHAPIGEVFSQL